MAYTAFSLEEQVFRASEGRDGASQVLAAAGASTEGEDCNGFCLEEDDASVSPKVYPMMSPTTGLVIRKTFIDFDDEDVDSCEGGFRPHQQPRTNSDPGQKTGSKDLVEPMSPESELNQAQAEEHEADLKVRTLMHELEASQREKNEFLRRRDEIATQEEKLRYGRSETSCDGICDFEQLLDEENELALRLEAVHMDINDACYAQSEAEQWVKEAEATLRLDLGAKEEEVRKLEVECINLHQQVQVAQKGVATSRKEAKALAQATAKMIEGKKSKSESSTAKVTFKDSTITSSGSAGSADLLEAQRERSQALLHLAEERCAATAAAEAQVKAEEALAAAMEEAKNIQDVKAVQLANLERSILGDAKPRLNSQYATETARLEEAVLQHGNAVKRSSVWKALCEKAEARLDAYRTKVQRVEDKIKFYANQAEDQHFELRNVIEELTASKAASEQVRAELQKAKQLGQVACATLIPALAFALAQWTQ
eukprot:TRINITY_DN12438_c0_g1_i1.p1 TRINITY_DN12438_c0_g1~~TRINITY_DN12438_c0_g1_i1.p1  ORF type:complete len:484 (-),score=168.20 TRINITY_DN12438_c0_g1_i1:133-1584(-)